MERSHRPPGKRQQQYLTREQQGQCSNQSTDLWMLSSVKPARTPWRRLEVERSPSPNRRCRSFPACSVCPDTADCSEGARTGPPRKTRSLVGAARRRARKLVQQRPICLRGRQRHLWPLWGFTGDEAEWRKRGEKREVFFHDSQARDLLCVSKSWCCLYGKTVHVQTWLLPGNCHSLAWLWHQLSPECWADEVSGWTSWCVK